MGKWDAGDAKGLPAFLFFTKLTSHRVSKDFEEWAKWSNFLISASCYRGFVSQMLQDYQRQLRDLKSSWAANLPKLWRMYLTVKSYR